MTKFTNSSPFLFSKNWILRTCMLSTTLGILIINDWPSFAASKVEVKSVKVTGPNCSANDTQTLLNADGDFEVRFADLFASTGGSESKECALEVRVQPPVGFALAINGASLEGAARAQNGEARITNEYSIESSPNVFSTNKDTWSTDNDEKYNSPNVIGFEQNFGPHASEPTGIPDSWKGECGALTRVQGKINLNVTAESGGSAEIYADRSLVNSNQNLLKWDWELVPCKSTNDPDPSEILNLLKGKWQFQYQAANGRTVQGNLMITGDKGTYRALGASWTGQLADLHPEAESVKGTWQALDQSGWLEFRPAADGKSFVGEWGYTNAAASGFWNGQRE
jgi:Domain of unknown function (DUF4360)